jgi:hypothetical protein
MPSADQHRNKANSNRKFLDGISLEDFPDWVVVAAFYTAVHLIEELLARYQSNSTFFKQFQREIIAERLVGKYLAEIEQYVRARVSNG